MPCDMRELGVLKIARPCPAKWSKMVGDDQVRYCELCGLNVYNLSKMTADQARAVIQKGEGGRLCVRFWARRDGTVITEDCPWRRVTSAWHWGGFLVALVLAFVVLTTLVGDNLRRLFAMSGALAGSEPAAPVDRRFDAEHPPPQDAPEWLKRRAMTVHSR